MSAFLLHCCLNGYCIEKSHVSTICAEFTVWSLGRGLMHTSLFVCGPEKDTILSQEFLESLVTYLGTKLPKKHRKTLSFNISILTMIVVCFKLVAEKISR